MSEANEADPFFNRLDWIGTTLEKIYDVLMCSLSNMGADGQRDQMILDFAHTHKHVLLSELTEEQMSVLLQEFEERQMNDE